MALNRNIAGFYNEIQSQNGLRYGYQFLVKLVLGANMFSSGTRGANNSIDDLFTAQLGIPLNTLINQNKRGEEMVDLAFLAKSTEVPQTNLVTTKVSYFAQSFEFPGIVQYQDTWNVTIQLDQRMILYKQLRLWQEYMSSIARNSGGDHTIPNAHGEILLLDQYGQTAQRTFWVEGIYPTVVPPVDFKYAEGSNELKEAQVTFKVQYFRQILGNTDTTDPFAEYFTVK